MYRMPLYNTGTFYHIWTDWDEQETALLITGIHIFSAFWCSGPISCSLESPCPRAILQSLLKHNIIAKRFYNKFHGTVKNFRYKCDFEIASHYCITRLSRAPSFSLLYGQFCAKDLWLYSSFPRVASQNKEQFHWTYCSKYYRQWTGLCHEMEEQWVLGNIMHLQPTVMICNILSF